MRTERQAEIPAACSILANQCALTLPAVTIWQLWGVKWKRCSQSGVHQCFTCSSGKSVTCLASGEMSWMLGISPGPVCLHYMCVLMSAMETDVVLFCRVFSPRCCLSHFLFYLSFKASSANNHNPFCSFQRHAKVANLSEWMVFCAAKAISQLLLLLLFFLQGLRSIQKLIWGINEPAPCQDKKKKTLLICDFWKIRCIILNLSPQITQWICISDALFVCVLLLPVRIAAEGSVWSALWMCSSSHVCSHVCLSLSLSRCLSFGQSAASPLTLHNLASLCVTNLSQDYCCLTPSVGARFSHLSVLYSPATKGLSRLRDILFICFPPLSVKHVLTSFSLIC